jgi:hypothetical protein
MGKRRQEAAPRKENAGKTDATMKRKRLRFQKMIAKMKKRNPDYSPKWKTFEEFHEDSKRNGKKGYENHLVCEAKRRSDEAKKRKGGRSQIDREDQE